MKKNSNNHVSFYLGKKPLKCMNCQSKFHQKVGKVGRKIHSNVNHVIPKMIKRNDMKSHILSVHDRKKLKTETK